MTYLPFFTCLASGGSGLLRHCLIPETAVLDRALWFRRTWSERVSTPESMRLDRAALVVHEAVREADLLHRFERQISLDLRGLLRPRDPEPVGGIECRLKGGEAALELVARRREEDDDARSRLRAEFLREGRARVVLTRGHATPRGERPHAPE
jgi:hypothetical protein